MSDPLALIKIDYARSNPFAEYLAWLELVTSIALVMGVSEP